MSYAATMELNKWDGILSNSIGKTGNCLHLVSGNKSSSGILQSGKLPICMLKDTTGQGHSEG